MFKRKALKPPGEDNWETSERSDEWNQRRSYKPMEVYREETEDGSVVVPAFNDSWDEATKLQWSAGLLKADTGFEVTFYQPAYGTRNKVDWLAFGMVAPEGASGFSSLRWHEFPLFSMGVSWGIRWARDNEPSMVGPSEPFNSGVDGE